MGAASVKVGRLRVIAAALVLAWPAAAFGDEPLSGTGIAEQFAEQARKVEEAHAAKLAEEERVRAEQARIAAEKLAAEAKAKAETTRRALEQMKADEAEMLARARAEAEERLAEMRRAEAEAKAKEAAVLAEREREERKRADEAARFAAEKAEAERIAKVEEARAKEAAEEARRREARRIAGEQAAEKARVAREADERAAKEAADRKAEQERQQAEAAQKALEAERQAEAEQLSEKLRRAREAHSHHERPEPREAAAPSTPPPSTTAAAPDTPPATPVVVVTPEVKPSAAVADPAPGTGPDKPSLVTVLLVMDPGNNGIRRFNKTADPILCVRESCYISTGPGTPATEMTRWRAFGTGNTLGGRAGACRNQLTCVFRNVDLGEREALIQPIDMRIVRHDRREALRATGDASCAMVSGALHCATLLQSKDWRAWIVPESVAANAGPDALQSALKAGLPVNRAANLSK